jgi:hypothetical protein
MKVNGKDDIPEIERENVRILRHGTWGAVHTKRMDIYRYFMWSTELYAS